MTGMVWALAGILAGSAPEPFAFRYGGKEYRSFEGQVDETLKVTVERREFPDFPGANWYTVWFENTGKQPSQLLEEVRSLDWTLPERDGVLRGILGDHQNFYRPYVCDLAKVPEKVFRGTEGRATHIVFPYFNLEHGDGGTLFALGWAGTWEARFSRLPTNAPGLKVVAENCPGLRARLLPGERIRTALVARLPYKGRDEAAAMNLWRRWFLEHVLPRETDGRRLAPFSTVIFCLDTGNPNIDGSGGENHTTWRPTLEKLKAEKIIPDFRWFDAGWWATPSGQTHTWNWWNTLGAWVLDPVKWPGKTFREGNDACHQAGMRTILWFEPERVNQVDDLCRNHGYRREWAFQSGRAIVNNLGDPDCFKWTLDRILKMLDENAVDLYREDCNYEPAAGWASLDDQSAKRLGFERRGIAENRFIQGHYALWDAIVAHCRANGKCPYLDSCASGGGRNDLDSLRRGFPLMRSDYDRTTIALRLSMSWGFNKWIPFHGTFARAERGSISVEAMLGVPPHTADAYESRASLLPIYNIIGDFTQRPDFEFDTLRRNFAEWKSIRHLLLKDFYTLTPWHAPDDRTGWTAFAYHDPKSDELLLLAFRQEQCQDDTLVVDLPFLKDPAKRRRTITLDRPRSSYFEHTPAR